IAMPIATTPPTTFAIPLTMLVLLWSRLVRLATSTGREMKKPAAGTHSPGGLSTQLDLLRYLLTFCDFDGNRFHLGRHRPTQTMASRRKRKVCDGSVTAQRKSVDRMVQQLFRQTPR